MRNKAWLVLLVVLLFRCEPRSGSSDRGEARSTDAPEAEGGRIRENSGCAFTFGYKDPYFPEGDGFTPLEVARDGVSREPVFEFDGMHGNRAYAAFGVLVDESGAVFRYTRPEGAPVQYTLTGTIERARFERMSALRQAAIEPPLISLATAGCFDSEQIANAVRVYDTPRWPFVLAIGDGGKARKRDSFAADQIIRWMLSVKTRAESVPPTRVLRATRTSMDASTD